MAASALPILCRHRHSAADTTDSREARRRWAFDRRRWPLNVVMIQDTLANAGRYSALHPLFAEAFAWLDAHRDAADGKYVIRGEDLYVIVETAGTHDPATRRFESHRRYLDIQVNLAGGEVMEWLPVADLVVEDDFQPDGDIAFYRTPTIAPTRLHVRPGEFTIFHFSDGHKPVCHLPSGPVTYRKAVFKVDARATGG